MQVSSSLRYQGWVQGADGVNRLNDVRVDGKPLNAAEDYRLVVNNFMAEGGDGGSVLRQGRDRVPLGVDIDAFVARLRDNPAALAQAAPGRIDRKLALSPI